MLFFVRTSLNQLQPVLFSPIVAVLPLKVVKNRSDVMSLSCVLMPSITISTCNAETVTFNCNTSHPPVGWDRGTPKETGLLGNNTSSPVADPGFPRGGTNLLFGKKIAKNCMKRKEIKLGRGMHSQCPPPLDPSMPPLLQLFETWVSTWMWC